MNTQDEAKKIAAKEYQRNYQKKYREENKEELKQKRSANKLNNNKYAKQYREKNRDLILKKTREYYIKTKPMIYCECCEKQMNCYLSFVKHMSSKEHREVFQSKFIPI
jgi:hypothetical protein